MKSGKICVWLMILVLCLLAWLEWKRPLIPAGSPEPSLSPIETITPVIPTVTFAPASTPYGFCIPYEYPDPSWEFPPTATPPSAYPVLNVSIVDGKLAFFYWGPNDDQRIVIMDADGSLMLSIPFVKDKTPLPFVGSTLQWSPDGRKLAFGCDFENRAHLSSICILDLVENMTSPRGEDVLKGLHVIDLSPERDLWYRDSKGSFSVEWVNGEKLLLTKPYCVIKASDASVSTDCANGEGDSLIHRLNESARELVNDADYIAPSPEDGDLWAIATNGKIYLWKREQGDLVPLVFNEKYSGYAHIYWQHLSWSNDGKKLAALGYVDPSRGFLGILNLETGQQGEVVLLSQDLSSLLDPNLYYMPDEKYPQKKLCTLDARIIPGRNISWSPDGRFVALHVYLSPGWGIVIETGEIMYFDTQRNELVPAKAMFNDRSHSFTGVDWYACDDDANVCGLYR